MSDAETFRYQPTDVIPPRGVILNVGRHNGMIQEPPHWRVWFVDLEAPPEEQIDHTEHYTLAEAMDHANRLVADHIQNKRIPVEPSPTLEELAERINRLAELLREEPTGLLQLRASKGTA